ncbi:DUF4817 domain-containing protein [Trichonephila clavipes]|nr:DUF4817 domain-containing protein [Trichonephila clavipes]
MRAYVENGWHWKANRKTSNRQVKGLIINHTNVVVSNPLGAGKPTPQVHLTFPHNSVTHQVLLFIQLSHGNAPAVQKMSRRSKERAGTGKERRHPLHKSHATQVTASKARQGRLMSSATPALYRLARTLSRIPVISTVHNFWPILQILDGASAVSQDLGTVLIRIESMIESTTNSNEFRSKDGTVVRIPDADFNIVPRSVTKNTTPCSTRIRTTTICVNNKYRVFFSSDEAHFWLNGYVNKQNCRIWSEANPQVYVETPLHPEKLTVWCALWAGGILLQKRWRPQRAVVSTRLRNCHTARATIDLLKDTFGDRLISHFGPVNWPPRSCDLTPLDYFLWGYVKSLVYADKPQTLDHLEDNIRRVIAGIRPQMLEKVIEN